MFTINACYRNDVGEGDAGEDDGEDAGEGDAVEDDGEADAGEGGAVVPGETYEHVVMACVSGMNMQLYSDRSVSECKALCSANTDCLAFEYGVDPRRDVGGYEPRACQLQSGASTAGCDGTEYNLDLYIKRVADADCNSHCADVRVNGQPWFDRDGPYYDCDWYRDSQSNGEEEDCTTDYSNNGYSSVTACCHCGGGVVTTCQSA